MTKSGLFPLHDIDLDPETYRRIKFAVDYMKSKGGKKEKFYHSSANGVTITILRQKIEGRERFRVCLGKYLAEMEMAPSERFS